jgi:hypothetical protein
MLATTSHTPTLGMPSRRAVKAAALLLRLAGAPMKVLASHLTDPATPYIALDEAGLIVVPTKLEGTLLVDEAMGLASERESVLIVRLATDLKPVHGIITLDVVRSSCFGGDVVLGLRPCLSGGLSPLSLVRLGARAPDFFVTTGGLWAAGDRAPDGWDGDAGIAAADAYFRANLWGGI